MKKRYFILPLIIIITLLLLTPIQVGAEFNIILNFDDGYQGVFKNAFPVMDKYQLPGVVFVSTKFIGDKGHLDLDNLKVLKRAGWEIGSHTVHHPNLYQLTASGLKKEILASKLFLEENNLVKSDYVSFAPPGTAWNEEIASLVAENYQVARAEKVFDFRSKSTIFVYNKIILQNTEFRLVKNWILKSVIEEKPLILIFHEIGKGPNDYFYSTSQFEKVIKFINENYQQNVITFYDLYKNNYNK